MALFCDEAQRLSRVGYGWLRDVHDQLAYHGVRLGTFLVGQPQLLGVKAHYQMKGQEQTVPTFTEFFLPRAYGAGMRLESSADHLWNAFVRAHA